MAYELIPRSARCDKHRLAAAWIESLGRCQDHAELLADHYVRALELARLTSGAIDELVQPARRALAGAGERAASLGAYAAASRHYERALELCPDDDPERAQLLLRYAKAIFLIDRDDAIAGAVDRARRALIESGDVEGTAQLDVMLGELAAERGDAGTAIDLLGRAAEALCRPADFESEGRDLHRQCRLSRPARRGRLQTIRRARSGHGRAARCPRPARRRP